MRVVQKLYGISVRGEFGPRPVSDNCLYNAIKLIAEKILDGRWRRRPNVECLKSGEYVVERYVIRGNPEKGKVVDKGAYAIVIPEEVRVEGAKLVLEVYVKKRGGKLLIVKPKYAPEGWYKVYVT